jgi:hypothetical protein
MPDNTGQEKTEKATKNDRRLEKKGRLLKAKKYRLR